MFTIENDSGVYKAIFNGVVIAKGATKYYVKKKAEAIVSDQKPSTPKIDFPINQRFEFVDQLVNMVATKQTPSCIITGEGGLGKSYTVLESLKKAGLKDISEFEVGATVSNMKAFRVIKGFSTAKGLFRILFENQNNIVVFDDCDSILKDPDALNILKGALDSFDKRLITWNTSTDNDNLPRFFQFKGGVIFISNLTSDKINQALKSRSMNIDLSMTADQKLDRMEFIMKSQSFLPLISMQYKEDAISVIRDFKNDTKELSLRTLITVTKIRNSGNSNWLELARYMLVS